MPFSLVPFFWASKRKELARRSETGGFDFPLTLALSRKGRGSYFNRSALSTTTSELTDIPNAASHGDKCPVAANGSATRL